MSFHVKQLTRGAFYHIITHGGDVYVDREFRETLEKERGDIDIDLPYSVTNHAKRASGGCYEFAGLHLQMSYNSTIDGTFCMLISKTECLMREMHEDNPETEMWLW